MKILGIPYFPYPSANDDRLDYLESEFRLKGLAIYLKLLQKVYGHNGYYYAISNRSISILRKAFDLKPTDTMISDIIDFCVNEDIWSKEMWETYHIITSEEIQKEYLNATRKRKNVIESLDERYLIGFALSYYKKAEESQKKAEEMEERAEETDKEKKTKQNKTKKNKLVINVFKNYLNVSACARVRERDEIERKIYLDYFSDFFSFPYLPKYKDSGYEIIDTMIEALEQASELEGLKFKQILYTREQLAALYIRLDCERFQKIVTQITFNENINVRPVYILSCVLTAAAQPKCTRSEEEKSNFKTAMLN